MPICWGGGDHASAVSGQWRLTGGVSGLSRLASFSLRQAVLRFPAHEPCKRRTPQPDRDAPYVVNSDGSVRTIWNEQFGSSHPAGANFVMCDGSVRVVKYGVDPATWAAACTRNGGEALNLD